MQLTLAPAWRKHSTHRGITIWRRVPGTGTSHGSWLAGDYFGSLSAARAYLDGLRVGQRVTSAEVVI